jgi:hypothetical protein
MRLLGAKGLGSWLPVEARQMMYHHISLLKKRWTGACLSLLVTSAVFLAAIAVQSQDKKQTKKSADDEDVIRVTSNLVSLDVIVKDKKGKPITDLKPEDFTVSENGVPQKIEFFDSTLTSSNEAAQPATATVSPTTLGRRDFY